MKISLRSYLALFLLLALTIIFISSKRQPILSLAPKSDLIVEQSMNDIKAMRFDKEGRLIQEVTMRSWCHYQGQTTSQLLAPKLTLYHADGGTWDIAALKGQSFQTQMNGKLEKLQLSENVNVVHMNPDKHPWDLKTQHMVFYPQTSLAQTSDPVVVNGNGVEIHAIGMNANLKEHTIELLKNVKSHYVTPKA